MNSNYMQSLEEIQQRAWDEANFKKILERLGGVGVKVAVY